MDGDDGDDGHGGEPAGDQPSPPFPRDSVEFNRIINLSDGVAAIALTLLVLTLEVPSPAPGTSASADIGALLDDLGTPLFAFALSFVIIASSWYGHHRFIARLRGLDTAMVTWNFAYLFLLVSVPFASDLIGNYGDNPSAVAVYAAIMGALYLVGLPGYELARLRGLLTDRPPPAEERIGRVAQAIPAVCFLLSVPLVLVTRSTAVGYWTWVAIWPLTTVAERRRHQLAAARGETDRTRHHGGF